MSITLQSDAFDPGESIPVEFTGDGADRSPPLRWQGLPAGTQQLALICDDPDAPTPEPWVHWVLYHLPPSCNSLAAGFSTDAQATVALGVRQGKNSWTSGNKQIYRGPAPPRGHGVHHYHFRLFALDRAFDLPAGLTSNDLLKKLKGHILATGELVGLYQR